MSGQETEKIPCFLCGGLVLVKYSKRGKPYFICDPCGVQAFIRRDEGIKRFLKFMDTKTPLLPNAQPNPVLEQVFQLESLKEKEAALKARKKLMDRLFPDKGKVLVEKALAQEIKRIELKLK